MTIASRTRKLLGEKSEKQLAFEREALDILKNADMGKFDGMMKKLIKKGAGNSAPG